MNIPSKCCCINSYIEYYLGFNFSLIILPGNHVVEISNELLIYEGQLKIRYSDVIIDNYCNECDFQNHPLPQKFNVLINFCETLLSFGVTISDMISTFKLNICLLVGTPPLQICLRAYNLVS